MILQAPSVRFPSSKLHVGKPAHHHDHQFPLKCFIVANEGTSNTATCSHRKQCSSYMMKKSFYSNLMQSPSISFLDMSLWKDSTTGILPASLQTKVLLHLGHILHLRSGHENVHLQSSFPSNSKPFGVICSIRYSMHSESGSPWFTTHGAWPL